MIQTIFITLSILSRHTNRKLSLECGLNNGTVDWMRQKESNYIHLAICYSFLRRRHRKSHQNLCRRTLDTFERFLFVDRTLSICIIAPHYSTLTNPLYLWTLFRTTRTDFRATANCWNLPSLSSRRTATVANGRNLIWRIRPGVEESEIEASDRLSTRKRAIVSDFPRAKCSQFSVSLASIKIK